MKGTISVELIMSMCLESISFTCKEARSQSVCKKLLRERDSSRDPKSVSEEVN